MTQQDPLELAIGSIAAEASRLSSARMTGDPGLAALQSEVAGTVLGLLYDVAKQLFERQQQAFAVLDDHAGAIDEHDEAIKELRDELNITAEEAQKIAAVCAALISLVEGIKEGKTPDVSNTEVSALLDQHLALAHEVIEIVMGNEEDEDEEGSGEDEGEEGPEVEPS